MARCWEAEAQRLARSKEKGWPRDPALPCSPCQLRRQSDPNERPEGGRGGCSRNRRGPDTSNESSAVKKVADGTSGHENLLRHPGSDTATAAIAPVPAGHRAFTAPSASLRPSPLATAADATGSPASPRPLSNPGARTSIPCTPAAGRPLHRLVPSSHCATSGLLCGSCFWSSRSVFTISVLRS